jgi:hypothetical protein
MRFLKNLIINFAPKGVIRVLRYYRPVLEIFASCAYICGISRGRNYPVYLKLKSRKIVSSNVRSSMAERDRWGEAFCLYNSGVGRKSVALMWADGPIPGNYGDWLSPYIITKTLKVNVTHVDEAGDNHKPHLVALGSILTSANDFSVVVGAGVSSLSDEVNEQAKLVSVRGPYTAAHIKNASQVCSRYGDIGFLLRRIYNPRFSKKNGILVVRHIQHRSLSITLDDEFREASIFRARPDDIESFIDELHGAELVATSAMHCFITCISYSIPCVLFSMGDWRNSVPGDGVKYKDSLSGVGLPEILPLFIREGEDFCQMIRAAQPYTGTVSDISLDKIEENLRQAVSLLTSLGRQ